MKGSRIPYDRHMRCGEKLKFMGGNHHLDIVYTKGKVYVQQHDSQNTQLINNKGILYQPAREYFQLLPKITIKRPEIPETVLRGGEFVS